MQFCKTMKRILSTIIALLALCNAVLMADELSFTKISTDQGLSHYTALSLYEDETGSVWVASPFGLSRCRGTQISVFLNDLKDPSSLSCNRVKKVTGNGNGQLYILTKQSFEIMDLRTDRIVFCLPFKGETHLTDIFYRNGLYAVGGKSEIYHWNEDFSTFDVICGLDVRDHLRTIFVDADGRVWTSTSNTLYKVVPADGQIQVIRKDIYVHDVSQDREGRIFISTLNEGLLIYTPENAGPLRLSSAEGLLSDFVRVVCQLPSGKYWVGTDKGIQELGTDFSIGEWHVADGEDGSLSNASVYDILCDRYGTVWTATYFGGLNCCRPEEPHFQLLKSRPEERGLSSALVSCMVEDGKGNFWIGSVDCGLTRYERSSRTFTWFRSHAGRNSISGDNIKTLYADRKRNLLWIGTHLQGFCSLDLKTLKFRNYHIPQSDEFPMADVVSAILPYGEQLILVTYRGVFLFSPDTATFRKLLDLNYLRSAYVDSRDFLWMGSTSGQLFRYDLEREELMSYGRELCEQNAGNVSIIYDFTEDEEGNLWMASFGGGLKKYERTSGTFQTMNTLNSAVPSDNILAVRHLGENRFIATMHDGCFHFDSQSGQFKVCNRTSGLPVGYVMENALYLSDDASKIHIGTNEGLLTLPVHYFSDKERKMPVKFSRLWVNGEEVRPGDATGILSESMIYVNELVLNHGQNSFAVEFFQLDRFPGAGRQLLYCLDGNERNWQKLMPGEHLLRFYNQPPGTYRILVKDPDQSDDELMETSLVVRIRPPFYRTTVSYCCYVLLLLLIAGAVIYGYVRKVKQKERLRYAEKKQHYEKAQMLSNQQAKLQFFFAISHEFSTPLTIILGQMESLLMKYDFSPEVQGKMDSIYKNSLQLHDLLFELLEFRKHEMGQMKLKVAEYDVCSIAEDSFQLYKEYSQSRGIRFKLETMPSSILVWCDRKQLYKVFNNLLSNAFKYTDEGGQVVLSVQRLETEICIQVSDNGCGMDPEEVTHIFDEFYQGRMSVDKVGVGIGLHLVQDIVRLHKGRVEVKSELDKGTTFFVYLKTGNGHFSLEELSSGAIVPASLPEPVRKDRKVAKIPAASGEVPASGDSPAQTVPEYTMLIVEDSHPLREMLVNIFSQYYKVLSAVDGKDGWNKLQQNAVDIVVSDIIMPNMNGTELCGKIKDNIETCHIPVVLLSVRAEVQNCIDGFNARADDYITKPFSVRLLLSRCENLLNNRELIQKKFRHSPNADVEVLTTNALDQQFTEKLIQVIEENLDDSNLNIAFLQEKLFVSRTTLFQKLKAITGQTPMEFIMNIRLKKAAQLLKTRPDLPVSEVSDMVGFGSSKYFSRIFKETYHIRPSDYRNGKSPVPEQ